MSHCCYGDGWCERCQAYMGPQARRVEAVVVRGATTPWSWASLPGLEPYHYDYSGTIAYQRTFIKCRRWPGDLPQRPEPKR